MAKTKTIVLFKTFSREKRDEMKEELKKKYPQFMVYSDHRQNRRNFSEITYQVKAQGPIEEIEKFLKSQETKKNAPIQSIIDLLKVELEPLRIMYLEKTKEWAKVDFARVSEMASLTEYELHQKYGKELGTEGSAGMIRKQRIAKGMHTLYVEYEVRDRWYTSKEVVKRGLEEYLERARKNAETHYQSSIVKLAGRIDKKKLNIDKMKAITKYSKVDVNISTILSDGEKSVRAWTIIASGEIQRPHYRYLVK